MSEQRAFTPSDIPQKKVDYHGTCRYVRTSPRDAIADGKSVNLELTFEQAMRLSLAIQAALFNLNRYNRSDSIGREMGLCLTAHTDSSAIVVSEYRVKPVDG